MTGSSSKLVYKPLPEDDPKVRQPDITKARTLLGWEPKVPLEEGLMQDARYFRTKLQRGEDSKSAARLRHGERFATQACA